MDPDRLVLVFLLATTPICPGAEWVPQQSGTQGTLAAVHFVDPDVGYAAGFLTVLKTTDGGITWEPLTPPANVAFVSVFTQSATDVFVGRQELYRSADGGLHWRQVDDFPEAPSGSIFDIKFISKTTGFVVKQGKIFRSLDGGENWDPVFQESSLYLSELDTVGGEVVYATGGITYDGLTRADFVRSYDGGTTWEVVPQPGMSEILAAAWVGPREGYAFTFLEQMLKTSDGGDSWLPVNNALGELVLDTSFRDAQTGFAVCYSGNVLSTTNGGVNWTVERVSPQPLSALARPCGGTCYTVGNGGRIFKRLASPGPEEEIRIAFLHYDAFGGQVELILRSTPCRRYRIEASSDLKAWTTLVEHVPETADWQFKLGTGGALSKFYRVAEVPGQAPGNWGASPGFVLPPGEATDHAGLP